MKRLTQTLPVFLAAALQLMPLVRNLFINPATGNTFAFILRWGIGTGAALGAVDAVSGASAPVIFTNSTNFTGTAGIYFTNNVAITNNGGNSGAFCVLTNKSGVVSTALLNGNSTTSCMPAGLVFKFYDLNIGGTPQPIYGAIYGTPTTPVTNLYVHVIITYLSLVVETNFWITILPAGSPPVITNQPVSLTNNVSSNATFTVTAGTAPLHYQWYFNTNTALLNATNTSLTLTNIQLTNTGNYRVIITNSSGSVTSSFATLTVWQPPVITNSPVSFTNVAGGSGSLAITAGGFPALAYQWRITTNLITTSIVGGTNASLSFTNLRACQAGAYTVILTNSAGSVTSAIANLVVTNPLPPMVGGSIQGGTQFQFTFTPIAGLTNTVLTNGVLASTNWGVFTNYPPTATPTPITISNNPSAPSLFYRLMVVP